MGPRMKSLTDSVFGLVGRKRTGYGVCEAVQESGSYTMKKLKGAGRVYRASPIHQKVSAFEL